MAYVPRKIVYPVFLLLFAIVFFSVVFVVSFYQPIKINDPIISVSGDKIKLTISGVNESFHVVRGLVVKAVGSNGSEVAEQTIGGPNGLLPGEEFDVNLLLSPSDDMKYEVFVGAPFTSKYRIPVQIDKTTVEPVEAEVQLSKNMVVNNKYDFLVKLCNVSPSDLFDVRWSTSVEGKYFAEALYPQSVPIKAGECKTLYSSLTPISPGTAKMVFSLRVGSTEHPLNYEVLISGE